MSQQRNPEKSNAGADSAQESSGVLLKLIIFSVSLGMLPLASYYGSLRYLWQGNSIYAAISAIVAANVVLVAYIITATLEERKVGTSVNASETKKEK